MVFGNRSVIVVLVLAICLAFALRATAQHPVMDPNDPVVEYDPANPPDTPPWGTLIKWVRTTRLSWNSDDFKAYFYKGMSFRIMWPANYDPSGNTKYPLVFMLHGRGEKGVIYDNEFSMKHSGKIHRDAVNDGTWPGFVVYAQNQSGYFGESHYNIFNDLINNHFPLLHADINRITVHGLSAGGQSTWKVPINFPRDFAAAIPMSAASNSYVDGTDSVLHIPIWLSQGGNDNAPAPSTSFGITQTMWGSGVNIRYTLYHSLGHGVWNTHYAEPDFFPFLLSAHKANPVVTTGAGTLVYSDFWKDEYEFVPLVEICPEDPVSVPMGVTQGFDGYEWRVDGNIIAGANSNTYTATDYGTYDARILRGSEWSVWSPTPIVVSQKQTTQTPDIQIVGAASKVIPAPDGSTSVDLELPQGFVSYSWFIEGSSTEIGNNRVITINSPGNYEASVTEQFGCSSSLSNPFTVVDANGSNGPDAINGLNGFAISKTDVQLSWSDNPSPAYNETGFEIYRSTSQGGGYQYVDITQADVLSYLDGDLNPSTTYYYIIRPVNENGAADVSAEINVTTLVDVSPPTTPLNLKVVDKTPTSITLTWDESTDDVGVHKYDVYRNDIKGSVVDGNTATVYNMVIGTPYRFVVVARDITGNASPASNQVVEMPGFDGLYFDYYEGNWTSLPNFNSLTPLDQGKTPNISIAAPTGSYFGFKWEGYINIQTPGNYTFETISDDGSKLYIGGYDEAFKVVDNDGLHGMVSKTGNYNFPVAGAYPIAITFFERTGGQGMEVYWESSDAGISREQIPNSAFKDGYSLPGTVPNPPIGFSATVNNYDEIGLSWIDQSNDEIGFQISRSTDSTGIFVPITITNPDANTYIDSGLDAETTYYYQIVALGENGQSLEVGGSQESILPINNGIAAKDNATGSGYIMFSAESVHTRFAANDPHNSNSNHLIAVKYNNGVWEYDDNNNYQVFTPLPTDLLIATVDFTFDEISGLEGQFGDVNGIKMGYATGDLTFTPNWWFGGFNNGEFTVGGTYFVQYEPTVIQGTTLSLPPLPNAPTNITATAQTSTSILLTWDDNSTNEDEFNIYRSTTNNSNYLLLEAISATGGTSVNYVDDNLFSNVTYFYKVEATNAGGSSTSNESSATTLNNNPDIDPVGDVTMRHGTTLDINLFAQDVDPNILTLGTNNLPDFAIFTDYGDGTGLIQLSPVESDTGSYYSVVATISDGYGGTDSTVFSITVNDNNVPTLVPVADVNLDEGESTSMTLLANDLDGNELLTWDHNLPPFAQLTSNLDGTAIVDINPSYIDAGAYLVDVTVSDPDGGSVSDQFTIIINNIDPNQEFLVNFQHNTPATGWNNITGLSTLGLVDTDGNNTNVGLEFQTTKWKTYKDGAVTGDNSGIYTDDVIKDYYYFGIFGSPNAIDVNVTGLDPNKTYDLTFFGSSIWNGQGDNGNTEYTVGGTMVSLYVHGNSQNTVTIEGITPDPTGLVSFNMAKATNAPAGYLNSLIIKYRHQAGSPPAPPTDLTANFESGSGVVLSWNDAPFNETGFEVHRSEDGNNFTLLNPNPGNENATSFIDPNVTEANTYYYQVRAINSAGNSSFSNMSSVIVPNTPPTITVPGGITAITDETTIVNITTADPPSNQVSLSVTGLPVFASFNDFGNGSGELVFAPGASDIGDYSGLTVTATDNLGATTDQSVTVTVTQEILYSVSINFSNNSQGSSPWNNTNKSPVINDFFGNLLDDQGLPTSVGLTLNTDFGGVFNQGQTTGDNSGVVPDNVLKEYYWFGIYGSPQSTQMTLSGLDPMSKYNFKFVGSSVFSGAGITDNGETIYRIGNKETSVDVQANTSEMGTIANIAPNGNGEIVVNILKGNGASVGYINAMIIEAFAPGIIDQTPTDLTAIGTSKTDIQLTWTDNAFEESGYEIYRSENGDVGPFTLISTTPVDATGFMNSGLSVGTEYTYKVRAVIPSGYTNYSNSHTAATMVYLAFINLNGDANYNSATPWNNVTIMPDNGTVVIGIKDENGNETGIRLNFVQTLKGANDWGTTTGNNTGVYPDNVLKSFFFMEKFEEAIVDIEGLDQAYIYNFKFLGAIVTGYTISTKFTVNGETVINWQTDNTTDVSSINGIYPDIDNKATVNITSNDGSKWSIWNSLVIEAYPNPNAGGGNPGARVAKETNDANENAYTAIYGLGNTSDNNVEVNIFPNPFSREISIRVRNDNQNSFNLMMYDQTGNTIILQNQVTTDLSAVEMKINFEDLNLRSGIYFLLIEKDGEPLGTWKILKVDDL